MEWKPSREQPLDLALILVQQAVEWCGAKQVAGPAEISIIGELLARAPILSVAHEAFLAGSLGVAVAEYRSHAERGNRAAQNNLGVMYETGLGVAQDDFEAVKWYFKAADQGDATAQYNIGVLLVADYLGATKCSGVRQQEASIQAYKWFTAASEQGYGDAVVARRILSEQMTPAQIAEAQKLAHEWKQK